MGSWEATSLLGWLISRGSASFKEGMPHSGAPNECVPNGHVGYIPLFLRTPIYFLYEMGGQCKDSQNPQNKRS